MTVTPVKPSISGSQDVVYGGSVTLTCDYSISALPQTAKYEWLKSSKTINSEESKSLLITTADFDSAAPYICIVKVDSQKSANSDEHTLVGESILMIYIKSSLRLLGSIPIINDRCNDQTLH